MCSGPISHDLFHKTTPAQRAAANAKVAALTKGDTRVTRDIDRKGTEQKAYRKAEGFDSWTDADHIIDLQLGGLDVQSNLWGLGMNMNRSVGAQIRSLIEDFPAGTRINKVTISD